MKPRSVPLLMAAALVVGACTAMPSGPSVMVLPGSNKTFDQFLGDDRNCRQFALGQAGGVNSPQASSTEAVSSSEVGASHSSDPGYGAQYRYDASYIQCMYASGHRVPVYGQMLAAPPATPPADYKPDFPPPVPQGYAP
ncbi:glycine zipper family protein [Cupriavidus sp. UYPR2.512]|uniref:glycine zipper family protein n=1 Tax=Cupriavidus sp. UYPR2.512 TaxID=1080187 RepID=UPI000381C68E|nr:glycine zipper family protein [Cupriavidus sp. UYPR2.512]UIF85692.1 glycine zipper family protein [Cupriavidus necator]